MPIPKIYTKIAHRIVTLRKEQGISQERLAAEAKINRAHMGHIEQGKKRPTVETLEKIAYALHVSLIDLFQVNNPQ